MARIKTCSETYLLFINPAPESLCWLSQSGCWVLIQEETPGKRSSEKHLCLISWDPELCQASRFQSLMSLGTTSCRKDGGKERMGFPSRTILVRQHSPVLAHWWVCVPTVSLPAAGGWQLGQAGLVVQLSAAVQTQTNRTQAVKE